MSLKEPKLAVTLSASEPIYYPAVLRILADGRWERLSAAAESSSKSELRPGETIEWAWPAGRQPQTLSPLERLHPLVVRYYGSDGVGSGQIVFLDPPPESNEAIDAGYADGFVRLRADAEFIKTKRVTWVLWPDEDDVSVLLTTFNPEHSQQPARRIEWQSSAQEVKIFSGHSQPEITLLHETENGLVQQKVPRGLPSRHQPILWIKASATLYVLALITLSLAALAIIAHIIQARRLRC